MQQQNMDKERSSERELVLIPSEGKSPRTNAGLVDNSLFTGRNRLRAIMEPDSCMWYFKYDQGVLPAPLKNKFTSFRMLFRFAEDYFGRRNIDIKEVKD